MSEPDATNGTHARRVIIATSIGTMIEGYDLLLYGYLAGILAEQFFPTGDPTAALLGTFAIFAVGFVVRPLGGIVFGHIGDRLGRRAALVGSILLMAGATLAIGLLPTYHAVGAWAPALLLICRLMQGFSVGGEYVGANILILEHSADRPGRAVAANQVATYLGIAAAAATSLVLARVLTESELLAWGWRVPFLAAAPLALLGLYLRLRITDSPGFQAVQAKTPRVPLIGALRTAKRSMLIFAGWLVMVALGGYLLFGYMSTYLTRVVGLESDTAFAANLAALVALIVGAIAGGYLVDRYPPRIVAVTAAIGLTVTVVPGFLTIQQGGIGAAILGQVMWAGFVGTSATLSALLSVLLFPVHVRYTGTAFAYNVTVTLFGGTAPYVSTWLVANTGNPIAPAWYLMVVALIGLTTALSALPRRAPA
jgi:MFS transporter, MHS family, proline/betaine transporter